MIRNVSEKDKKLYLIFENKLLELGEKHGLIHQGEVKEKNLPFFTELWCEYLVGLGLKLSKKGKNICVANPLYTDEHNFIILTEELKDKILALGLP